MLTPQTLNIVLTIIIVLFVLNGLWAGVIHMIGSFIGLIFGVLIASRLDTLLGAWISKTTGWNNNITTIIAFIVILLVVTRLFGLLLSLLEKTLKFLKLPLVGIANHLIGGVLGFLEGVLVLGATLILINSLPFINFIAVMKASSVALGLMSAAKILLPLLPKVVRDLYIL